MNKKALYIALFIILALLFYNKAAAYVDPDFGWHLQMGNLITRHGIPATDPFSYTMPSYPFIDHEWLTNVIFAKIYNNFGNLGLAIIFSLLATATVFIASFGKPLFAVFPFLLLSAIIFPAFGVRPQAETWLLLAILIKILFDERLWKKFRTIIPLLFVLWVNLHGGFSIGLATLLVFMIVRKAEHKLDKTDIIIVLTCILATFLNPYGPRIWNEIWMQAKDSNLHFTIEEWTPGIMVINAPFIFYMSLMIVFLLSFWKKLPKAQVVICICFLLAALSAERNVVLWAIVSSPLLISAFELFRKKAKREKSFFIFYKIALGICALIFIYTFVTFEQTILTNHSYYPTKAIEFLKADNPKGNVFSSYNWGGFLIWQYPEKKVFVDGRMPSWSRDLAPIGESKNAFSEYKDVILGKNAQQILKKYNVCTILLPKPESKAFIKLGFEKIYSDNTSVVYKKKNC